MIGGRSSPPALSQVEIFTEYLGLLKKRTDSELEAVRQCVADSDIPLSDEILARILSLFSVDAYVVMRSHKGFAFAERRQHYRASLSTMLHCLDDLGNELLNFEQLTTDKQSGIMLPKNAEKLKAVELRIQKELFATTNAAASLVDHVRRLQLHFELPGFREKLKECFKEDGLHELVIGLRILLHHLHIVQAGWVQSSDLVKGTRTTTFTIDRAELDRAILQSGERFAGAKGEPMRRFLSGCHEHIDLSVLFGEYRTRLDGFYGWLNQEIEAKQPLALLDYDRCVLEIEKRAIRTHWKALLANFLHWDSVPDLHKFLPDYLNSEQLDTVYKLPKNSHEQADLVVSYIDTKQAADAEIYSLVCQVFERISLQEAKNI